MVIPFLICECRRRFQGLLHVSFQFLHFLLAFLQPLLSGGCRPHIYLLFQLLQEDVLLKAIPQIRLQVFFLLTKLHLHLLVGLLLHHHTNLGFHNEASQRLQNSHVTQQGQYHLNQDQPSHMLL